MHIIIDATTTQDQFAYAGIGNYTKNIIIELVKNSPDIDFSLLLFEEHESTLDNHIKHPNVSIESVGKYHISNFRNEFVFKNQFLPVIKRIMRGDSVYFCPYFWRHYPAKLLPTILFIHDFNIPLYNMYSQKGLLHNLLRKIQYWRAINDSTKCKYLLCNSETTKNDYIRYFPNYNVKNIKVTYLSVDLDERHSNLIGLLPKDYRKRKYLIYLGGGINKNKNSDKVILAYNDFIKKLKTKKPPYLVIAGKVFKQKERKDVYAIHKLINTLGIENHVIFTGFYKDIQKFSLLNESFAFIHLSSNEGFGIAPLEAVRARANVILYDNKAYREVFENTATFVNGRNIELVANTILDIYKFPEKYRDLKDYGYTQSLQYNWKRTAEKTRTVLLQLYHELGMKR